MNYDNDTVDGRALLLKCRRCNPLTALGQNPLVEFGYCVHRRIAIARSRQHGRWWIERAATPVEFADLVLTIAMLGASEDRFWMHIIAPGSEGGK